MSTILLQTKLIVPPIRPLLVPRPQLIKKLHEGQQGKLTLISAPAGYGKTTLAASWLAQLIHLNHAWLSLDEYDNDIACFLRYFTAALQSISPQIGHQMPELLESSHRNAAERSPEAIMTTLINDLVRFGEPSVLILDDYHIIENKRLHKALTFWLDNSPMQTHLLLISRTEPALPLSRWRVRGQLTQISSNDLRFTPQQAAKFLQQVMQLDLSAADIALLAQRSEGWVASLQLAALSLQGTADPHQLVAQFTGSERQLMDYLLDEVLQKQTDEIHQFLLQTSILQRFNIDLCRVVTAKENSQELLDYLDRHNLFLNVLDADHDWYRYHPLFAEFLQTRLQQTEPALFRQLHQRACHWFAAHGFEEEAITHALAAEAYATAADLIASQARIVLWQKSHPLTLGQWCAQLPPDILFANPQLALINGWAFVFQGQFHALADYLERMSAAWSQMALTLPDEVRGEVAVLRGELLLVNGRISESLAWFGQADDLISTKNQRVRATARQVQGYAHRLNGDITPAEHALNEARLLAQGIDDQPLWFFASADLAHTLMMAGRLNEAQQIHQELLDAVAPERRSSTPRLDLPNLGLGRLAFRRNELPAAEEFVKQSIALSRLTRNDTPTLHYGYLVLAEIQQAMGNWLVAQKLLRNAATLAHKRHDLRLIAYAEMVSAKLHLLQGDSGQLRPLPNTRPKPLPVYQTHQETVVNGRILMQQDIDRAIKHLDSCRATAVTQGWDDSLLEIHILLAVAQQTAGHLTQALDYLALALETAVAQGYVYPFIVAGAPMAQLLRRALSQGLEPDYVGHLQAAFMPTAVATQPLLDPLTNRELEVLALMANGLTNPEIATKLILATGTVAKYSNNIYSKLNVRNRTEAAQRAKDLGLIEA